ncbi:MAG: hypothetical protein IPM24_01815 [Bryobacterales bacterium]|nr:hypothetical protein [Bryobacterales bacterium]
MDSPRHPPGRPTISWPFLYLCVALTTLATLLLELSLTRVFSVVFYYHFAFLAISIALFGLGAGGLFSYVLAARGRNPFATLGHLSGANAGFVALALIAVLQQKEELTSARLAVVYFVTALPFFVSGAIVSTAISETLRRVDRVYFWDLIGAAGGCLLLVPLLNQVGGPNTVLCSAVLFAVAAAVWHNMAGNAWGRVGSVALALLLVGVVVFNWRAGFIDIRYAKGQKLEQEEFVRWNSFSRVAVAPEKGTGLKTIVIDADASTGIASFDFSRLTESQRRDLLYQGPGLPYAIRPGAETLIIGPGGGWDVARALATGSRSITGVEINPLIANTIMKDRFAAYSRGLYLRRQVNIVVEDGRSFVRRTDQRYQVLQATLVDTWASTAAGAFALSENNLYTVEAFKDYLRCLTNDGLMAFTRWGFDPPRESLRLLSLARAALDASGEPEPWRHVIVAREGSVEGWGARDTVIVSRKPLTPEDLQKARETLAEGGMEAVYLPDEPRDNAFDQFLRTPDPEGFQAEYPFDISPVTDNRPFFFYTVQPRDLWDFITQQSRASADYKINRAVPLLFGLVAVSLAATFVVLALPPLVLRTSLPRDLGVIRQLLFFVAIGAGYILIEVALIQKFVLLLGHPTHALTVVIFSMLVSSGLGSYCSRLLTAFGDRLWHCLAAIALLVAVLAAIVPPLLAAGVTWPQPVKMAVTVLLIFPAGFLMGMPFPTGLRRLETLHEPAVRWAWSLNAAASVLGSVLAIVLAIYLGLMQTMLIGAALYAAAILTLRPAPAKATA